MVGDVILSLHAGVVLGPARQQLCKDETRGVTKMAFGLVRSSGNVFSAHTRGVKGVAFVYGRTPKEQK